MAGRGRVSGDRSQRVLLCGPALVPALRTGSGEERLPPDVVAYPEDGYGWVATRDADFPAEPGTDAGLIARFDLPH